MGDTAFGWDAFLTHLPRSAALCRGILGTQVMTTGSGPVEEGDFDTFLGKCNIAYESVSESESDVLVIGQEDWDENELNAAIRARVGGMLRVYSQEMVIASLAMGADVFETLSTEELSTFGNGHPALEYLYNHIGFEWPTTDVEIDWKDPGDNGITVIGPDIGVLKNMGYTVGKQGLDQSSRREILHKAMEIELVAGPNGEEEYIEQWGPPMSAVRLQKMANCIASFAKAKKRVRNIDYSEAIADWESDLAWLKATYYKANLGFRWPYTTVSVG